VGTAGEENGLSEIGEPLREMASALVDGEASEFECRRVLGGMDDGAVGALLGRHYTVRTLLRREAALLCPESVTRAIVAAVEAEPVTAGVTVREVSRWRGWTGGAAVAASVCLLAVGAVRTLQPEPSAPAGPVAGAAIAQLGTPARQLVPAAAGAVAVGFGPTRPQRAGSGQVARERLQWYMVEHAQNAALNNPQGMMPFARVASYEEP
jgi:sigma-E factor negative regulatory protein RseA